ncbi:hypothetical protein COV04_02470 [Candidatus Uhrbacteria bacterium CG10_big_fil_rev_8_21_14_0_10_48_11]|uniref:Mur ligase central domain-containing protein n=1 Tax=Candidatus Uhrbacteria bacterium CG10_big_fil_rev_8_21_14_0_10_48_11 TaxID=1975037 RepID=A0A2M8LEA7_9BACT|nr:MAG: hypothetical protein COV04_02470 [Candidatus Uhrbacteria bacterium CG10_big_fil_rev_8_21_14_0_10_48_11]
MRYSIKKVLSWFLCALARYRLGRSHTVVVAVAGIVGKSTAKRTVAKKLKKFGEVFVSKKNYNTEIGLPLTLLDLEPPYSQTVGEWGTILYRAFVRAFFSPPLPRLAVVEFGVAEKGDMLQLLKIVTPIVAVITNISVSDFNSQTTLEDLSIEFAVLAASVPKQGLVVLNGDNNYAKIVKSAAKARIITYGAKEGNEVHPVAPKVMSSASDTATLAATIISDFISQRGTP